VISKCLIYSGHLEIRALRSEYHCCAVQVEPMQPNTNDLLHDMPNNIASILPVNWSSIKIGFYDDLERCGDEDKVAFTPHRILYIVRTYSYARGSRANGGSAHAN